MNTRESAAVNSEGMVDISAAKASAVEASCSGPSRDSLALQGSSKP